MKLTADDRIEILELCQRYNWTADYRDDKAWAACFAADGEVFATDGKYAEGGGTFVHGRDAIEAGRAISGEIPFPFLRHWTDNDVIEVDGDRVIHRGYWMAMVGGDGAGTRIAAVGHYRDHLVRTDEGWLFQRREMDEVGHGLPPLKPRYPEKSFRPNSRVPL